MAFSCDCYDLQQGIEHTGMHREILESVDKNEIKAQARDLGGARS